jgi:hypothetical protein
MIDFLFCIRVKRNLAYPEFSDNKITVSKRFQIQEMIAQDTTGVVFQALDTQTGKTVAVRRFFPFGSSGDGLQADEETAYKIALGRLGAVEHQSLRSVIDGGCDPVDRMPFIVTEWVDGESLSGIIQNEPLPVATAVELIMQALDVCELVSHVFAEEGVWVETDLRTIVLGGESSGRGFTFWISPFKWLVHGQGRGFQAIITLTEEVLFWRGRVVGDQAGGGLGAWLRWLRGAADTASLHEVRENLAAALGVDPPPVVQRPQVVAKSHFAPKKSKTPVLYACGFTLVAAGIFAGVLNKQKNLASAEPVPQSVDASTMDKKSVDSKSINAPPRSSSSVKVATGEKSTLALVNERQAELARQAAAQRREIEDREKAIAARGGVFTSADGGVLMDRKGRTETLEGIVAGTAISSSGKTLYLYFSEKPSENEPRAAIRYKGVDQAMAQSWLGKQIRLTGKVAMQGQRAEIVVTDPQGVKVTE